VTSNLKLEKDKNMKITTFTLVFLMASSLAFASGDIATYMSTYRANEITDVSVERELLAATNMQSLLNDLEPFYIDSLVHVRRKAYFLTYKKALADPDKNEMPAIIQLVKGCSDINSTIINQNIDYLKQFPTYAFDLKAKQELELLLLQPKYESFSDIYLVAGFLGIGYEEMNRLNLNAETSKKFKWILQLALARMGNSEALENILRNANQMETGDNVVAYLVPHLVYTRQKLALDYCVKIIFEQEKNCSPPNAESSKKIECGYRVMELVALVIEGFPLETDAMGMIVTDNYTTALEQTRATSAASASRWRLR
jgi:hypothetical protein